MIEVAPLSPIITKDISSQAWLFVATCTHNGKYDWRVPTEDECERDRSLLITHHATDSDKNDFITAIQISPVRDKDD